MEGVKIWGGFWGKREIRLEEDEFGWETRIRTWVDGVRVRSPAAGRSPKSYILDSYKKGKFESIGILAFPHHAPQLNY